MEDQKEIWITEGNSIQRRRGKESICKFCNKTFVQRMNGDHVYCSPECVAKSKNCNNTYLPCHFCGKIVKRSLSKIKSKKKIVFCNKECQRFARTKSNGNKDLWPSHYQKESKPCKFCQKDLWKKDRSYCSNSCKRNHMLNLLQKGEATFTEGTLRKLLIILRGHRCEECKLSEWKDKPIPLDMHHTDGNHKNNAILNLKLLCKNCHALTNTYGAKNIGNGRHSRRIENIKQNLMKG